MNNRMFTDSVKTNTIIIGRCFNFYTPDIFYGFEEYPDNVGVSRYRDSRKKETEIG